MGYRVYFENGQAIKAIPVEAEEQNYAIEFENDSEHTVIQSFYIDAENEEDAIVLASKVAKNIWGESLQ